VANAVEASSGVIDIRVSDDLLEAYLIFRPGARLAPPASADVSELLKEKNILVDRDAMQRVTEALTECRRGSLPRGGILLNRGQAPGVSKDETLVWKIEPESGTGDTPLPLRRAKAGDTVAVLSPPETGQPGLDVRGKPIVAEPPKVLSLTLGPGLRLAEDRSIRADADGVVLLSRQILRIEPLTEVKAEAIDATKGLESPGVLLVHGDPPAGAFLQAKAGLFVDGKLGSALITSGGPLVCTQGLEGQSAERTRIDVRGDMMSPHIFDAMLKVQGNLIVTAEICRVKACVIGELKAHEAVFSGGEITVSGHAELGVMGSPGREDTVLAVGVHHDMRQQYDRLGRVIEQLNQALGTVEQACFLSNTQRADPSVKEKICQWELAREDLTKLRTTVQAQMSEMGRSMLEFIDSRITVNETIHPGCTVTVAGVEGRIAAVWAGPVTVVHHMISGKHALVVESKSGRKLVIR
jgi:hypothetical protein